MRNIISNSLRFNRIGRVKFLAYTNLSYGVLAFAYYFTFGFDADISLSELYSQKPYLLTLFAVLSFILIKILAQRYRDAGISGWWALVGLIPYTYFFLYIFLGCYKGETHANEYGKIPAKSGVLLQLLAYLPIVLLTCFVMWCYWR